MGPTPGGAGPEAMPRKESLGRRDVRVLGMGSRESSGATSLLKRARGGFVKADMWWAGQGMGLMALMIVRERFDNKRSWCVDILCRSNHGNPNWQGKIAMGEKSKEAAMLARWRVGMHLRQVGYAGRLKRVPQKITIRLCRRKNTFEALVR